MKLSAISTVDAYDAKTHFRQLLDKVESGETITITRHGTPVARLIPVKTISTVEQRREAIEHWIETSRELWLDSLKSSDLIHEGRRSFP